MPFLFLHVCRKSAVCLCLVKVNVNPLQSSDIRKGKANQTRSSGAMKANLVLGEIGNIFGSA